MIENVNISPDGDVSFTIVLTTPACPVKEQLKQQSESVVKALPGVRSAASTPGAIVAKIGPSRSTTASSPPIMRQ